MYKKVAVLSCMLSMVMVFCFFVTPVAAKTYKLKFHHHNRGKTAMVISRYQKAIEEATNGQVKIIDFPAATLGKPTEAYELVTSGTADISWGFVGFFPGQFPMTDVPTLPLLGGKSGAQVSRVYWNLYEKFPKAFDREFSEVKLLALHSTGVIPTSTISTPIQTLEGFKGMKVRTPAGPPTEMMKALGATPMTISVRDIYSSLEKGVVEGCNFGIMAVRDFKLHEILNYFHDTRLYATGFWIAMNQNVWDSLPEDIQQQIMGVSGLKAAVQLGSGWDEIGDSAWEFIKGLSGKKIITYADEDRKKWSSHAKPIWEAHVKKLEAKGLPGREVLEYTKKLMEEID